MLIIPLVVAGRRGAGIHTIRRRHLQYWLGSYVRQETVRFFHPRRKSTPMHVLLCVADHFEPSWGGASDDTADTRVAAWLREYPVSLGSFRDSDGRPPRHPFFHPIDEYQPR